MAKCVWHVTDHAENVVSERKVHSETRLVESCQEVKEMMHASLLLIGPPKPSLFLFYRSKMGISHITGCIFSEIWLINFAAGYSSRKQAHVRVVRWS